KTIRRSIILSCSACKSTRRASSSQFSPLRNTTVSACNTETGATIPPTRQGTPRWRSEEHTSELQSRFDLVCRLLLEKKKHIHLPSIIAREQALALVNNTLITSLVISLMRPGASCPLRVALLSGAGPLATLAFAIFAV